MAIKVGEKDLFPYLGDCGPVSIYKGEQKLAGYKWAEKSGQELHFDNTYNSSVQVEVDGQSYQHAGSEHAGSGKNLVRNFEERTWSYMGVDYHIDKHNIITINGTSETQHWVGLDVPMNITNGSAVWQNNDLYLLKENTDYILSVHAISGNYSGSFQVFILPKRDSYKFEKEIRSINLLDSPIVNTGSDNLYSHFIIRANLGTVFNNFKFKLQLEEGSVATEYEPPGSPTHGPSAPTPDYPVEIHSLNDFDVVSSAIPYTAAPEDITENDNHSLIDKISINLGEPLRSVGDVHDRLYKDSDGLWKIERNVAEQVFDGTENWNMQSGGFFHGPFSPQQKFGENGIIYASNILKPYKQASYDDFATNAENNSFNMNVNSAYIRIKTDKASTVEGIKSFLSTNNLKVVYQLADPTIEILDEELQDKLNNLRSFKGSNYVYTVQNTDNPHKEQLKPTLHAKAKVKDI